MEMSKSIENLITSGIKKNICIDACMAIILVWCECRQRVVDTVNTKKIFFNE